jgi:hypothetical protein
VESLERGTVTLVVGALDGLHQGNPLLGPGDSAVGWWT